MFYFSKILMLITFIVASLLVNDLKASDANASELANSNFTVGWYFWKTPSNHFYLAKGRDDNIQVWQFMTDTKEWIPTHNASFRDYPIAGEVFDSVSIDTNATNITFGDNNGTDAPVGDHELANASFQIGWYFWNTPNHHFYLAQPRDRQHLRIWQFMTDTKEWIPVHQASFSTYPAKGEVFNSTQLNSRGDRITIGALNNEIVTMHHTIASGLYHSVVVDENGSVYTFGKGKYGALGQGDESNYDEPTKLDGISDIVSVAAGSGSTILLNKSGEVYSFGNGFAGKTCHGDEDDRLLPTKISGLSGIVAIATKFSHTLLLDENGTVYGCGYNPYGNLGDGAVKNLLPTKISNLHGIKAISTGFSHSLALDENGTVYSFGDGRNGELGLGNTNNSRIPTKIPNLTGITDISTGYEYSLVVDKNGTIYSFGRKDDGELGLGDVNDTLVPTKISTLTDAKILGESIIHSMVIDRSGDLYTFGDSESHKLGYDTDSDQYTPRKVLDISDVVYAVGGYARSLILTKRGELYVCGGSRYGEAGMNLNNSKIPLKIEFFGNHVKVP